VPRPSSATRLRFFTSPLQNWTIPSAPGIISPGRISLCLQPQQELDALETTGPCAGPGIGMMMPGEYYRLGRLAWSPEWQAKLPTGG